MRSRNGCATITCQDGGSKNRTLEFHDILMLLFPIWRLLFEYDCCCFTLLSFYLYLLCLLLNINFCVCFLLRFVEMMSNYEKRTLGSIYSDGKMDHCVKLWEANTQKEIMMDCREGHTCLHWSTSQTRTREVHEIVMKMRTESYLLDFGDANRC